MNVEYAAIGSQSCSMYVARLVIWVGNIGNPFRIRSDDKISIKTPSAINRRMKLGKFASIEYWYWETVSLMTNSVIKFVGGTYAGRVHYHENATKCEGVTQVTKTCNRINVRIPVNNRSRIVSVFIEASPHSSRNILWMLMKRRGALFLLCVFARNRRNDFHYLRNTLSFT